MKNELQEVSKAYETNTYIIDANLSFIPSEYDKIELDRKMIYPELQIENGIKDQVL